MIKDLVNSIEEAQIKLQNHIVNVIKQAIDDGILLPSEIGTIKFYGLMMKSGVPLNYIG